MAVTLNGKPKKSEKQLLDVNSHLIPFEGLNWLIHLLHVKGEIIKSKDLLKREVIRSRECNEYALFKQGIMLREEGKFQESLVSFQTCLKLNPQNVDYLKEAAKCLYLLQRYRLSLEACLEAEISSKKKDWELCYNIGQCFVKLGEASKAKEYLRKAVQISKHECAYELLVQILVGERDYAVAIEVCSNAVENCPDSSNLLTELGLLHLRIGQVEMAFEKLSQAVALEPTCAKALLGIGCITQLHQEFDVALTKYKLALQSKPESVALWNNIGMCFYAKQKYIPAVSCLKRALWFSPLNWKVLSNLGRVHFRTQQPASAFNFLCAAVNLRPDVGLNFMLLGYALLELQDLENAFRAFRQAAQVSPENSTVMLNVAAIYLDNKRAKEALEVFSSWKRSLKREKKLHKELAVLEKELETVLNIEAFEGIDHQQLAGTKEESENSKIILQDDEV